MSGARSVSVMSGVRGMRGEGREVSTLRGAWRWASRQGVRGEWSRGPEGHVGVRGMRLPKAQGREGREVKMVPGCDSVRGVRSPLKGLGHVRSWRPEGRKAKGRLETPIIYYV